MRLTPKDCKEKPDQKKRVMILRCIDVEDMRIQTKRQAKSWIDIIEHRLKRLGIQCKCAGANKQDKTNKAKEKKLR